MKYLYLISQYVNNAYDTYDSAVVCAKSAKDAKFTHPDNFKAKWCNKWDGKFSHDWCDASDVVVKKIGVANDKQRLGVICSSFHAG